jgi:hypothetical protein
VKELPAVVALLAPQAAVGTQSEHGLLRDVQARRSMPPSSMSRGGPSPACTWLRPGRVGVESGIEDLIDIRASGGFTGLPAMER